MSSCQHANMLGSKNLKKAALEVQESVRPVYVWAEACCCDRRRFVDDQIFWYILQLFLGFFWMLYECYNVFTPFVNNVECYIVFDVF